MENIEQKERSEIRRAENGSEEVVKYILTTFI